VLVDRGRGVKIRQVGAGELYLGCRHDCRGVQLCGRMQRRREAAGGLRMWEEDVGIEEEESVGFVGRRNYCRVRRILNVPVSRYDGMAPVSQQSPIMSLLRDATRSTLL
jgi:hypothetical protein